MEIREIKSRLSIDMVLGHYGLAVDKSQRLHCPFHDDKTPSMQVYAKTNTVYCFSSNCNTHGKSLDTIDFIKEKENITKHEAIKKARQLIEGTSMKGKSYEELSRTAILTKAYNYFKTGLQNSKPARDYVEQRGLDYSKIEIGYNTGQFHHNDLKNQALIGSYLKSGLLSESKVRNASGGVTYRAFAKYSIVFALRNRSGQISGLYFRSTVNDTDQKHFYLKESEGLYPCYPKEDTERLIISEAIIDAATLLQNPEITSKYSILSAYGTNRLSHEHIEAIKELRHLKEIIFAFDSDEAGRSATAKYAIQLKKLLPSITITTLSLPEGEDLNSLTQSHEQNIFGHLLDTRSEVVFTVAPESIVPSGNLKPTSNRFESEGDSNGLNTRNPFKISYKGETATYYIQGGVSKILDSMKVTLVIEHTENGYKSRNKLDLYEDKQVEKVCKDVSEKLNVRKDLLEGDIYKLTDLLDEFREKELQSTVEEKEEDKIIPLTIKEREQIETFAKKEHLIPRLNELLGKAGIVGEEKNRIFLLLIAISYKMPETLHALIQGSSGSGKTRLLKQISDCIPKERVTKLTRVSDKVLYNYPEKYFINRLLCLEDIDGLSEEAEFAFRELQSNGELNSATSSKLENGQIVAGQKTVKGPIASLACTTRGEIYEDNMSRVFLIAVDESTAQTKRIIHYQNEKAAGEIDQRKEQEVKRFIQNFVRELKPYEVLNPYASKIQLPEEAHKIRRLNDLFQNFVKMVTVLNQYQRKKDDGHRLLTEKADLQTAIEIMFESIVLKVDELDGSLRQFYESLKEYLKKTYKDNHAKGEFTQREIRQVLQISKAQIHRYLVTLIELEYIQVVGGHANKGFKFRVSYWDDYKSLRERVRARLEAQLKEIS